MGTPATSVLRRLGSGWTAARRRARGDAGQGALEYVGVFAAVVVVIALVAVAFSSPAARTATLDGVEQLVCAVTSGPGCAGDGSTAAPGGSGQDGSGQDGSGQDGSGQDGSGQDGSGQDGSGQDGSGQDGSGQDGAGGGGGESGDDGGCEGFWGCAWAGAQQVGSGVYNVGKGAWDDVSGLVDVVRDPGKVVDAVVHLWHTPSDLFQLVWDDESGGMWADGDYGGAIGRTIWNVGSWFIPGVNVAKLGSKGGKFARIADALSEVAGLRRLADDASAAADRAADAARRGDVDAAQRAADEARARADEAAEQARRRGCPVAAGPAAAEPEGAVVALATGRADALPVVAVLPVLATRATTVLAGGTGGCGDATGAARDADEAADAAEAAAARAQRIEELAADPAHGGRVSDATRAEAEVGLGLEDSGQVPGPIRRSTDPGEEFVDASGQAWDVKAFRSQVPGSRGGFTLDAAMRSVRREVGVGENVMVDTRNMTAEHVTQLREAVAADPSLAGKVLFYP